VIGILSLLGAHRLYLLWRDHDLDVEREIREAVQDLREEAEHRLRHQLGSRSDQPVMQDRQGETEDHAASAFKPDQPISRGKQVKMGPSVGSGSSQDQRQPTLAGILFRLSNARKTCCKQVP